MCIQRINAIVTVMANKFFVIKQIVGQHLSIQMPRLEQNRPHPLLRHGNGSTSEIRFRPNFQPSQVFCFGNIRCYNRCQRKQVGPDRLSSRFIDQSATPSGNHHRVEHHIGYFVFL